MQSTTFGNSLHRTGPVLIVTMLCIAAQVACLTPTYPALADASPSGVLLADDQRYPVLSSYPVGTMDVTYTGEGGSYSATIYYPAVSEGRDVAPYVNETYAAVIFEHGAFSRASWHVWIGTSLASHGYVALLFTLPTILPEISKTGFEDAIGYLTTLSNDHRLKSVVDVERIGVMGHSMGAAAAMLTAASEPRIKSVVAMAPPYNTESTPLTEFETVVEAVKHLTTPIQIQVGSLDCLCNPVDLKTNYYDNLPTSTLKEWHVIEGGNHIQYIDFGLGLAYGGFIDCEATITPEEQRQQSANLFLPFLRQTLGDPAGTAIPEYPPIGILWTMAMAVFCAYFIVRRRQRQIE